MRFALAAASAAAVTGLALLAVAPAHADEIGVSKVDLHTTLTGPLWEPDDLGAMETMYELKVTNELPVATDTATGVVIRTTAFECPRGDLEWMHCTPYLTVSKRLGPIKPGAEYSDMLILDLPNNQKEVWFRLSSDVTQVDQLNMGPAPDSCVNGLAPGGPCAASTLDLLP